MIVEFDKYFEKSIKKLKSQSLAQSIADVVINVEQATTLQDINALKKLVGFKNYFRIRIGDYRVGLRLVNPNTVRFIIVAHRKDNL